MLYVCCAGTGLLCWLSLVIMFWLEALFELSCFGGMTRTRIWI